MSPKTQISLINKNFITAKFLQGLFLVLYFISKSACAELVVSLRSPETTNDKRENYNIELVTLALEKTKAEYGDYRIAKIPPMNTARSFYSLEADSYPNLLVELSYQSKLELELDLIYINFPMDLGIVGYRVCFASPKIYPIIENVQNIDELKKFTIGQGAAWADIDILRHNGLKVEEISNFNSLFKMVVNNRIDLFCRGANELQHEYESLKNERDLLYGKTFVIHYPLPRFYYLNKKNSLARDRIEKGLLLAYQDGSVKALWEKHFLESVEFLKLKHRKIFNLENPFISSLDKGYSKYFYDPIN